MDVTNRDFCLAFYELSDRTEANERPLEDYLCALWKLSRFFQNEAVLSFETVVGMFEEALTMEPPPFDEAWRENYLSDEEIEHLTGYSQFEAMLQNQIVDLRGFAETGGLPFDFYDTCDLKGWENIQVFSFLEHGAAGKFDYWNYPDEIVPLLPLTWEVLADFLLYCQIYE